MTTATLAGVVGLEPLLAVAGNPLTPVDLRQVRVGGEIGRRIDVTVDQNLLALEIDKDFLPPFPGNVLRWWSHAHMSAGLGKTIEAAVRFAAYTRNSKVLALKKRLVEETIKTQEPDGYIGIMSQGARMWRMWDVHEMGYIILGLACDYHYFQEKRSLEAARKLADYIVQRWSTMPADWSKQTHYSTDPAVMGLDRAMLAVYHQTGQPRFLTFCIKERSLLSWNLGIVIGRRELMEGDASAYLSKCVAQMELHGLEPQKELLSQSRRTCRFLTAGDGMCITGAVGQQEVWTNDQDGRGGLGETCATVYQTRLFDRMLQAEGDPVYGDLLERTIYNALFAAQSPDGRRLRYYVPMEGNREYFSRDTYCCPCNYRRGISELPAMIYYQSKTGLVVNLYTPSRRPSTLAGDVSLAVRRDTDYPSSGHVVLRLDRPGRSNSTPVANPAMVRQCRGQRQWTTAPRIDRPGAFLTIQREWKAGDHVTLDMPMSWRLVLGRKRQSGRAAVMQGSTRLLLDPAQRRIAAHQDGADLGYIVLDPTSLENSPGGGVVRRAACLPGEGRTRWNGRRVLQWPDAPTDGVPDPQGKCVYFRLPKSERCARRASLGRPTRRQGAAFR